LGAHLSTFADRPTLRSLAGRRHRVSSRASPQAKTFYLISYLEQGAVAQHGVHDNREPPGERDAALAQSTPLGDLERPALERERLAGCVRIELAAS